MDLVVNHTSDEASPLNLYLSDLPYGSCFYQLLTMTSVD